MRNRTKTLGLVLLVITSIFVIGVANAAAAELKVDNDGKQCPTAKFTSIQAAIDAAKPGDTVKVCAGTYAEQVTVGGGKNGLKLVSDKPLQAKIKAPETMTTTGDIVQITGSQNVQLKEFTIAGPLPDALIGSTTRSTGVTVDGNASATIERNHITDIHSTSTALYGTQNGIAIQVGRQADNAVGTATIRENTIDLYQKGGIAIDGAGSSAKVENNVVTNPAAPEINAANGIQVSRTATASVKNNKVSGNIYTGAAPYNATGILLYLAGVGTLVENNEVFANDDGISLSDTDNTTIKRNKVHDQLYDGLFADEWSTGNLFDSNQAFNNNEHDCHDNSTGLGTGLTENTWTNNKGETANVADICTPGNVTP